MQVKIFESPDMATGLKMVRKELGPNALILSTRTVRNGKLGILGKATLEITAAVDKPGTHPSEDLPPAPLSGRNSALRAHRLYQENRTAEPPEEHNTVTADTGRIPVSSSAQNQNIPIKEKESSEIEELKSMVKSLAHEVSMLKPLAAPDRFVPVNNLRAGSATGQINAHDRLTELLADEGVSTEAAAAIVSFARETLSFEDLASTEKLTSFLHDTISGLIEVSPPSFDNQETQKRIALLGPTGVGKTTTLAKIAAHYICNYSNSIALVTIDTYRIAAVEQLKVYGEIMKLPVEVVLTPQQLQDVFSRHADKDLILIDTAGRSPRDHVSIEELKSFLPADLDVEKHLVLSAVTRENELVDTVNQFGGLGIDKTIFTKLDECTNLGILLNIQIKNKSPLSYLTNGQRVPEDLLEIDRGLVSQLVIPAKKEFKHEQHH